MHKTHQRKNETLPSEKSIHLWPAKRFAQGLYQVLFQISGAPGRRPAVVKKIVGPWLTFDCICCEVFRSFYLNVHTLCRAANCRATSNGARLKFAHARRYLFFTVTQ